MCQYSQKEDRYEEEIKSLRNRLKEVSVTCDDLLEKLDLFLLFTIKAVGFMEGSI